MPLRADAAVTRERFDAVLFDLDGVLVDTGWAHKQAWYDLAEKEGLKMSDAFFYSTFGMRNDQIIPKLAEGISTDHMERLSVWKEQRYREIIAEKLTLPTGVGELLEDLKENEFLLNYTMVWLRY